MARFAYKSFCWNFGSTSFRTENFNRTIELQLDLLDKFWNLKQNSGLQWSGNDELQANYYDFLKQNNFVDGEARNKPKDAREKTSGLVELGLISDDRKLTQAGQKALQISKNGDFSTDNAFQISKDSFLYLKQLLKVKNDKVENSIIRPMIVTLQLLLQHEYLMDDEFKFLLPLCTNADFTEQISSQISLLRSGEIGIDEIITNRILAMENYQSALKWFLGLGNVSESDICDIGMNRKSPAYDRAYFGLYETLREIFVNQNRNETAIIELLERINVTKLGGLWKKFIFSGTNITKKWIRRNLDSCLNSTKFDNANNKSEFKLAFFHTLHLLKAKATLGDYADLNRRYLGLSDIFLFRDGKIELDIIPKHFFGSVINELYADAFVANDRLQDDCRLSEISASLILNDSVIIDSINDELGLSVTSLDEAMSEFEKQRYERFNALIDEKFSDEMLIDLLGKFENRDDKFIKDYTTNNAEIPTIFEYILGIAWYKISEKKGKILDYMKLSLDADLLPKSHAVGGEADIVYEYEKNEFYPTHTLLLEATLADKTNQRRMELEPVSRHLGQHLLRNNNKNSYCVFATTHLDINVLNDFRYRKITPYTDPNDSSRLVEGMKITPLQTTQLKTIIANNHKYKELYTIFDEAYNVDLGECKPKEWHERYIVEKL